MLNDTRTPAFAPPDADRVYANYLEKCKRRGINPVPRECAKDLMREWSAALADRSPPTQTVRREG